MASLKSVARDTRNAALSAFAATALFFSACEKTDGPNPEPKPVEPPTAANGNKTILYDELWIHSYTPQTGEVDRVSYYAANNVKGGYINSANQGKYKIEHLQSKALLANDAKAKEIGPEYAGYVANGNIFIVTNIKDVTNKDTLFLKPSPNAEIIFSHMLGENANEDAVRERGNKQAVGLKAGLFRE